MILGAVVAKVVTGDASRVIERSTAPNVSAKASVGHHIVA